MKELDEFHAGMRTHLRELECIADDLDEMAGEAGRGFRDSQRILAKSARIYDVAAEIRYEAEQIGHGDA